jgi:DNA-directed RNA polymerase I subunit RPA2
MQRIFERAGGRIGKKMESFLATGNLVSSTGMDLCVAEVELYAYANTSFRMQAAGFSIVAERLNYFRFLSHFQSVHRGQYFTNMKTTSVRKLLPER